MMSTFEIFLVILSVNFFQLNGTNTTKRRCETPLRNGTTKVHCCDNQEAKNGLCIECEVGFISDRGEPCQPCIIGLYGRKCGDKCTCNAYEICNHVEGCLNITHEVSSTPSSSEGGGRTENAKTSTDKKGSMNMEMIIYIICTSGVTFVLTLCLVTMKRYRKRCKKNYNVQQGDEKEKKKANATNTNQEDDYDGRVYDLIDESQMIDISPQYSNLPGNSSVAKDELNLSDGYLNSYQPMIPDPVIHDYTTVNPVDETDQPKYINVLDEHHSIFRMPQSNETINSSVQNSLASPFRDNLIHPQRSDYISMHQNDLLSTGINLPMECHTGTVISNEIDES